MIRRNIGYQVAHRKQKIQTEPLSSTPSSALHKKIPLGSRSHTPTRLFNDSPLSDGIKVVEGSLFLREVSFNRSREEHVVKSAVLRWANDAAKFRQQNIFLQHVSESDDCFTLTWISEHTNPALTHTVFICAFMQLRIIRRHLGGGPLNGD